MSETPKEEAFMTMWVIYDSPRDFPGFFVARMHELIDEGSRPTEDYYTHRELDMLRLQLHEEFPALIRVPRDSKDDEKIVETWL